MTRCDYCVFRNSWDCDECGLSKMPEDKICEHFKLDFPTLDEEKQLKIQKIIMKLASA